MAKQIGFLNVPSPLENAEWATKMCWESREGFSSGGKGLWEWAGGAEMLTNGSEGREWPSRQRGAKIGFLNVPSRPLENAE